MRNLKKALALVMVFALVLGTVASAATFSDIKPDFSYSEEVNLLADLGVLAGFPDGTYQPEATITRVQAAAVIFRILTGRSSAAMYDGATKFYDVPATYWGTGYINYCADIGAIGGYPDGSFKPDQAITVAEYESMLVRALGLAEGKTLSFPNGYLALADANLINEDVDSIAANAAANRGLVSKLTYNTIMNATYQTLATRDDPSPKIIEKIFKIVPTNGIITATQFEGTTAPTGAADKFTFDATLAADAAKDGIYKFAKVTPDMIGQKVKMYLKTNTANDSSVYAVVVSSDNKVVETSMANLGTDSTGTYYKVNGVKNYITSMGTSFVNGVAASITAGDLGKNIAKKVTMVSNDANDKTFEYTFVKEYSYSEFQQATDSKVYTTNVLVDLKASNGDLYDVSVDAGLVSGDKVLVYQNTTKNVGEVLKCTTTEATLDGISGSSAGGDLKYTFSGASKSAVRDSTSYAVTDNAKKLEDSSNLGKAAKFIVAPFFGLVMETSQGTGSVGNYYYLKDTARGAGFDSTKNLVKVVNTKGETLQLTFATGVGLNGGTALKTFGTDTTPANQKDDAIEALLNDVYVLTVNSSNEITAMKTVNVNDAAISNIKAEGAAYLAATGTAFAYTATNVAKNPYSTSTKLLEIKANPSGIVNHKVDDSSAFFVKDSKGDIYVYTGAFPATVADNMQMIKSYSKADAYNTLRAAVIYANNKPTATTSVYGMTLDTGAILADSNGQAYANFKIAMGGEIKTLSTTSVAYTDTAALTKFDDNATVVAKGTLVEFSLTSDGKIALSSNKNPFKALTAQNSTITSASYALNQTGNIGYVADFSGNILAVTAEDFRVNAAPADTKLFKVADDVKVYEVKSSDIGAATVSARGAVQVIKVAAALRTKIVFVYDLSSTDESLQKVTEIYVIKA